MSVPDWMIDATNMPKAQALETLAKELPQGWNVQITVENGGYDVTLFDPADNMIEIYSGAGPEGDMLEALRYSKWREANDDVAVDKAWKRFQAAMNAPMPSNSNSTTPMSHNSADQP